MEKGSFRDSVVRAVALIGLLLVLILGAWGIILLVTNLPTIASNVGNSIVSLFTYRPGTDTNVVIDEINVTAPASVKSGSSFVVSWEAPNADESYRYTVSYACANGLTLKAPSGNGSYQTVPCATPFNFVGATSKMTLIPTITTGSDVPMSVVVSATREDDMAVVASGSTVVNVTKTTSTNTNTGSSNSGTTYVPSNNTSNLYGSADLAVRITSINSLSSQQGRVAVVFEVENIGTNLAPAGWMFTANLPVGYSYLYSSATQQALYPGDKIVYTLGFNSAIGNQYCTLQYPNQNCPWYQTPYQAYPYQGTCYRYDGYQNIPVACTNTEGQPIYTNPNYNQNYNYGYQYNYSNPGLYAGNLVTITVDPRNFVWDQNRGNNAASIQSPIY